MGEVIKQPFFIKHARTALITQEGFPFLNSIWANTKHLEFTNPGIFCIANSLSVVFQQTQEGLEKGTS